MHDTRQPITALGPSDPFGLLAAQSPFVVSFRVTLPEGVNAVYGVEYTLDDLAQVKNPDWIEDPEVPAGTDYSAGGTHHAPIRAIRVNVDFIDPDATIYLTVIQGAR